MGELVKKTVHITKGQEAFLKRKKAELCRFGELGGIEDQVTDSRMFQALLEVWMAWDVKERENREHKKNGRKTET